MGGNLGFGVVDHQAQLSNDCTTFDVAELEGVDGYKLATGLVVPRPIGWIGTLGEHGVPNLAPYSFFNVMSGNPPTVVFAPGRGVRKDTLDNVERLGEFSVNIVTAEVVEAMNATSASVEADVDEFDLVGLTAMPSTKIGPPIVGECKAAMECVVTQVVEVGRPGSGNALVIGEAVAIHVHPSLLDGTRVDQAALRAVGRHVGNLYSNSDDLFELIRPA